MCIFFTFIYIFVIIKQYFIAPIVPPYHKLAFGAHNFVPFMATADYIEQTLKAGKPLYDFILYAAELICLGIPFGYMIRVALRKLNFVFRIIIYILFPAALEFIQYYTNLGRADIDDCVFSIIGILIGVILFHIMNAAFQTIAARDFMISRAQQKNIISNNFLISKTEIALTSQSPFLFKIFCIDLYLSQEFLFPESYYQKLRPRKTPEVPFLPVFRLSDLAFL